MRPWVAKYHHGVSRRAGVALHHGPKHVENTRSRGAILQQSEMPAHTRVLGGHIEREWIAETSVLVESPNVFLKTVGIRTPFQSGVRPGFVAPCSNDERTVNIRAKNLMCELDCCRLLLAETA